MAKKILTAEQIREEVRKRILRNRPSTGNPAGISVPVPKAHSVDAEERNWNMEEIGHVGHDAYVRRVVEEARKEFFLSDAADDDETMGDSFAHR